MEKLSKKWGLRKRNNESTRRSIAHPGTRRRFHDAVQLEYPGVPTVMVCTGRFENFAREKAVALKAAELPLVSIPIHMKIEEVHMKKFVGYLTAVIIFLGLVGLTGSSILGTGKCIAAEMGPTLLMGTPVVKMGKKSEVVIMGTGFKSGQELVVLFTAPDGSQSDIGYALKPAPKADKTGSFACIWSAGRYVSKGLITGGAYKIEVTDTEFNPLAHSVVFFTK